MSPSPDVAHAQALGNLLMDLRDCRLPSELVAVHDVHVDKRRDYADAGIQNYWIVDIDDPISLTACRLTEEFGYVDDQTATGSSGPRCRSPWRSTPAGWCDQREHGLYGGAVFVAAVGELAFDFAGSLGHEAQAHAAAADVGGHAYAVVADADQ
jgi:hypothetical protein